jgi:hypothetical protein
MTIAFRFFIASETALTPVSQARWNRLMDGQEPVPHRQNREVKSIEVTVEIEHRTIRRVVRVLPVRMPVDEEGRLSVAALLERAMNRLPSFTAPPTIETAIAQLQQDASYFWPLAEQHWQLMSEHLELPVKVLKQALHRSPEGEP